MVVTGETFAEMKSSEEAERIADLERRIKLAVRTRIVFEIVYIIIACICYSILFIFSLLHRAKRGIKKGWQMQKMKSGDILSSLQLKHTRKLRMSYQTFRLHN